MLHQACYDWDDGLTSARSGRAHNKSLNIKGSCAAGDSVREAADVWRCLEKKAWRVRRASHQ